MWSFPACQLYVGSLIDGTMLMILSALRAPDADEQGPVPITEWALIGVCGCAPHQAGARRWATSARTAGTVAVASDAATMTAAATIRTDVVP
jgi:hypothetical protein